MTAGADTRASWSGRPPPAMARRMRASNSAASDWRKSSRSASISGSTGSAMAAQASLRVASARAAKVAIEAASADSGPGAASAAWRMAASSRAASTGDQLGDEIGLGREIAVDRAGGDAGALGDGGDLHRRHAVLDGERAGGLEDGLLARGQPADHAFGAAVGHGNE